MTQRMSYYCDECGTCINDSECPVVVYLVAGHLDRAGGVVSTDAVHPGIRALLEQPIARREWCAACAPAGLAALLATPAQATANPAMAETSPEP